MIVIVLITMISHTKVEVFMLCINGKRVVFTVIVIVIAMMEKQLCELFICYTNQHDHEHFCYLRYLRFGSRYCGNSWSFSHGTDGFNPYDYKIYLHETTTEKTTQYI